jgi:hypothetical protein
MNDSSLLFYSVLRFTIIGNSGYVYWDQIVRLYLISNIPRNYWGWYAIIGGSISIRLLLK